MKEFTFEELIQRSPNKVIELAVKGMLPRGPFRQSDDQKTQGLFWSGSSSPSSAASAAGYLISGKHATSTLTTVHINAHSMEQITATGRRKNAVARVILRRGTGKITINKRDQEKYFGRETDKMVIRQPLEAVDMLEKFDIFVNVKGGGTTGQSGAIRHGISRALVKHEEEFKPILRKEGFITRDSRSVERKKIGLHKARKRPQYSKR